MANSPASGAWITKWLNQIHLAFQEGMTSALRTALGNNVYTDVEGSSFKFPYLGALAFTTKTNSYDIFTQQAPTVTPATATLTQYDSGIFLSKRDLNRAAQMSNFRDAYTTQIMKAGNLKLDAIVIAALDAATPGSTITDAGTGLTPAKLLSAGYELDANAGVWSTQMKRYGVFTPKAFQQSLSNTEITSSDYVNMHNLMKGTVEEHSGFTWVKSGQLTVAADIASNYTFIDGTVGLAIGDDLSIDYGWDGQRKSFFVAVSLDAGAAVIDTAGLVEVQSDETV